MYVTLLVFLQIINYSIMWERINHIYYFFQTDTLEQLFRRISEKTEIDAEYLTFTYNGKQYRYNSDDKNKRIIDIGFNNGATLFIISRVLGGNNLKM